MNRIEIHASSDYEVLTGAGLLETCGKLVKEACPGAEKCLVVSETNVAPLYFNTVKSSLEREGFSVYKDVFEAGESSKNISTITGMWGAMADAGFTRTDIVITLGGGVTGDMGGFAAATFLRGIRFVQIPTSLLAMADASVGGKTGIDLKEGKNLVGAFHQPSLVIEDVECLKTLPADRFTEGMAEIIKMALIMDKDLFEKLEEISASGKAMSLQKDTATLLNVVCRSVADKAEVVMEDEHDNGRRQLLNFGHTIGHVIERDSNFSLAHGVCVAKGMGIMSDSCLAAGYTDEETCGRIKKLISDFGLPVSDPISPKDAVKGAMNDKKKRGSHISVILVNRIGEAEIRKMTPEEFMRFLSK